MNLNSHDRGTKHVFGGRVGQVASGVDRRLHAEQLIVVVGDNVVDRLIRFI